MKKVAAWILAFLLGACAAPEPPRGEPLFISGRVLDQQTMQPIEGAYVLAGYFVGVPGSGVQAARCVRTAGMFTGVDGEYRFPIERPGDFSPSVTSAIKPGYRVRGMKPVDDELWRSNRLERYAGRDLYLVHQDRKEPVFLYGFGGDAFCVEAATTADAEAGRRFLEIQREEMVAYDAPEAQIRGIEILIRLLKAIDERPPIMAR
jgi:hypothetical protein